MEAAVSDTDRRITWGDVFEHALVTGVPTESVGWLYERQRTPAEGFCQVSALRRSAVLATPAIAA